MKKKFKRILLKLSGEGLMGDQPFGIDENVLNTVSESIRNIRNTGLELCIVIGGGNFYRGVNNTNEIICRPVADQAGMLATVINALFLKSALNSKGIRAEILSGLSVPQIAETYSYRAAQQMLADGVVVIFAGGTGNPYFTTDTGATLRALEAECDALFKATQVDGVYDSDPKKNPEAKRYTEVSYDDVIAKELKVKVNFTAVTPQTREALMDNGTIDMLIATYTITDERKASYAMSNPYYYDQIGFLVQTKSGYKKLSDLNGKTIGVSQGSSAKAAVEEYASANNLMFNYVQLGSYPELAVSLYAYRIDAFAGDKSILSGYESDKTKILDEGFKTQEYGIASSKSNQELIDYTNDLLAKWQKDGSLQKLYDKYHLKPAKAEDK